MDSPHDNDHIYMHDNAISFGREAEPSTKPQLNYKENSKSFSAHNGDAISKMNGKLRIIFVVMVISFIVTLAVVGVQSYWIPKLNIQNIDLKDETINAASTLERKLISAAKELTNESANATRTLERNVMAAVNDVRDETRKATSILESNLITAARDLKNESRKAIRTLERNLMAAVNEIYKRITALEQVLGWYRAGNYNLYKVFTERANYTESLENCEKYGARLAVDGIIDATILRDLIDNLINSTEYGTYVGLDDRAKEGTFMWLSGKPLIAGEVRWNSGEPNDDLGCGQDCAYIRAEAWNFDDHYCETKLNYICEKVA